MNAQDVLNRARTEGVELIRFMYCDFTGVQRGKVTAIDDLANRLSHGINLTTAQMAFTLINTIVPIAGMSPFCVKLTRVGYGSCSFMYHRDIPSM